MRVLISLLKWDKLYQQYYYSLRMVTFVCEYCDTTLKKKQVDGHIRGRCSPGAVVCIDCSCTFYGNDHKAHITCISEQDKHWGQFAKNKKTKPIAKPLKHQQLQTNHVHHEPEGHQNNGNKCIEQNRELEENNNSSEWKGWKNEIKQIIAENDGPIASSRLRKKLKKVYKRKVSQPLDEEQFEALFVEKVQKIKGINKQTYFSLA